MRGKLSDQDLTNYALNELDARERLYVESMLAVSVECRDDVYQMLDVAQMLEEGFERETVKVTTGLTSEQRQRLLIPLPRRRVLPFIHKAAAAAALAACVAVALANSQLWQSEERSRKIATVSSQVSGLVNQAVAPVKEKVDISSLVNLQTLADDPSSWIQTASEALPQPTVVCTPPSWLDSSDFGD